jgi:hypothetical protein
VAILRTIRAEITVALGQQFTARRAGLPCAAWSHRYIANRARHADCRERE